VSLSIASMALGPTPDTIIVTTGPCFLCKKQSELVLTVKQVELLRTRTIQHALPDWTLDQREQLMTGTHPECWDRMMGPEH
jgi:hypothetical protein